MNKFIQAGLLALAITICFTNCRKKAWDEFYDRPNNLAPAIYQQLEQRGNFTSLLALIDKSGYKETLKAAGYWTFFAPTDSAFTVFFRDKGIAGVTAIDSVTAGAMVQYLLVYNSFEKERLDDYQATANNAGWTPSSAFRRRTAYYTSFYKDTAVNNRTVMAVANNRNSNGSLTGNYISSDYNNKYITYFTDDYFKAANLSAADYNYFYPNSTYTGFNVGEAKVLVKNLAAENGMIHIVDRVITPLMNIDEYIRTRPEYSSFKAILNRLYVNNTVQFIYNADATRRYQVLKGKNDSVFVKVYSPLLAFAPNNENFLKAEDNDGQKDCWTMFIPKNDVVDAYIKNTLCQYYPSLDVMPIEIITDFINSHLFPTAVWPTKFAVTRNKLNEPARFDLTTDIFDKKILSNGFIYGVNKVQEAQVFSTVYSKAYLNPNFTIMTRLLNASGLKLLIAKADIPVNVFMIPDQVFKTAGYSYNSAKDQFEYLAPNSTTTTTNGVNDKLVRIANTCIFFDPYKTKIENLSGSDIVKSGDQGLEGDFIKFNNNTIVTSGLQDLGLVANVDSVKTATNGKAYFLNQIPYYSEKPVGTHIKNLGIAITSSFNYFWQYLNGSVATYNAATTDIIGLTGFSTVFVPTNAAVLQAVQDGLLPGTGTAPNKVPTFAPTAENDKDLVRKFLQYHIISGRTIVPDGLASGSMTSFLKNTVGNAIPLTVFYTNGSMFVKDNSTTGSRTAGIILSQSNNLSNRSVIHLIDNYLKYNLN